VTYFDTSALVKRFVQEKGTPVVQSLFKSDAGVATAKIAYAEIFAGLARKLRERSVSKAQYSTACRQFESEWQAYVRVELQDDILVLARDLIQRHPLKGFDAVHLASALRLKSVLAEEIRFVAADKNLLRAAQTEMLKAINVETVSAVK